MHIVLSLHNLNCKFDLFAFSTAIRALIFQMIIATGQRQLKQSQNISDIRAWTN